MHHLKHNHSHPLLVPPPIFHDNIPARKLYATFTLTTVAILAFFFLHLCLYSPYVFSSSVTTNISISHYHLWDASITIPSAAPSGINTLVQEGKVKEGGVIHTTSVLLPGWEILVVVVEEEEEGRLVDEGEFYCVYPNNATTAAKASVVMLSTGWRTFKCELPASARRRQPFPQPVLTKSPEKGFSSTVDPPPELLRWNNLVYEAVSMEKDVIVFVKGVNNRQGMNRSPGELNCMFGNNPATAVRTAVSSSAQEVFRCGHPDLTEIADLTDKAGRVMISVEIVREKKVIPSLAYYSPWHSPLTEDGKPNVDDSRVQLCACTMVYNAAKFLKEWVAYNSKIGVDRFILYDNDSDDNLTAVIEELNGSGNDVRVVPWVWQKTQEAGFSHGAITLRDTCTWMMFMDVDEFIYLPGWDASPKPSPEMLKSLIPKNSPGRVSYGQLSIKCLEFGPSDQHSHPPEGVMQGYTCRMKVDQRHKSIVMLEAVDPSLVNAVHHFELQQGYRSKLVGLEKAVVNHYKYQAWPEFRTKFRRRVSSYVVDWTLAINLASKDRAPGLGHEPIEPPGWAQKFCEVRDSRLKEMTLRWLGEEEATNGSGDKVSWQR